MTAKVGDNSINGAALRAYVERIEKLAEEKAALAEDIKEVYGEVKGAGFAVAAVRRIVADRRKDADKQRELEEMLKLYREAMGI